jgi:hypothetical protein
LLIANSVLFLQVDVIATKKKRSAVNRYTIADFHFRTSAPQPSETRRNAWCTRDSAFVRVRVRA